jgi:AraC-like DNA-binding protein
MEGQQRVGVLVEVPQLLREMGHDPAKVVAEAGIHPGLLQSTENALTFAQLDRLLTTCVVATQCHHFGLLVGQRATTSSLGLVGQLMRTAPTLKEAILDLCTNQRRYVQGAVAYLVSQEDVAFWGYAVHHRGMEAIEQLSEGAIAAGFCILRELADVMPDEVYISRRAPSDIVPYLRFFGSKPRFDAQQYALAFPASLLDRSVRTANRELRKMLQDSVSAYWALEQPSITHAVTRLLRARVVFPGTSLEEIAGEFSMQPRTLNRRLRQEGKTFRELVNEARFEVARQLLGGTRMDITDVALALGYADTSGFTHAFQRWSGVAPSEWRNA